uniref:Uncharacterized protein n=1 Tax=Panagrolaimus sp. ES5 TaxID=591445 RepID=A0AC34G6W0_9BILA
MPPETIDIIAASFALRKTIMIVENGKELVLLNKQFGDVFVLLRENRNNDYLVQYAAVIQPTQAFQTPPNTINNGNSSDDNDEDDNDNDEDDDENEGHEKESDEALHPQEAKLEDDEPHTTQNEAESSDDSTIMDIFALRQRGKQIKDFLQI